ncbi:hypothetical protein EVAR_23169_1 [Eumeta japonica]|uniref:Uncharacterized protein n=1 Tax=Eumeta variegata TaxID=151549 RepID=A0A4C1VBM1_EUMVA|nr:hypothetical protein EVAR_23169_1 [Eumeta japonica]
MDADLRSLPIGYVRSRASSLVDAQAPSAPVARRDSQKQAEAPRASADHAAGWTDNEIFTKLKGEQRRLKRSSLTLPQVKRDEDSPDKELKRLDKSSSVEKLPAISPNSGSSTSDNTRSRESSGDKPKRNGRTKPQKKKIVKRLSSGVVTKIVADDHHAGGDAERNGPNDSNGLQCTPEAAILRITGGVELVPLLARRRRVGARTLPSSDVTRPPEQPCQ